MIFVDTGVFIGAVIANDDYHVEAAKLIKIFKERKEDVVISNLVLVEVITAIGYALGGKTANTVYGELTSNPHLIIVYPSKQVFDYAMLWHLKYDGNIGLNDLVSYEIMRNMNIEKIASFDSDFDRIEGIKRITKL